jgi:hypothetical protein
MANANSTADRTIEILNPADVCTVAIEGLGTLENVVLEDSERSVPEGSK